MVEKPVCKGGVVKKILVVEDQIELLKLECVLLSSRGYDVKGAESGEIALEQIASEAPDLVLLDVMMPGIDGFQVCERIKSNEATQHIPVIMVTAKGSHSDMDKGQRVGANWYIVKPFRSVFLLETIQRFLADQAPTPSPA
jgi:twitching motility two-component system response regulator PilG